MPKNISGYINDPQLEDKIEEVVEKDEKLRSESHLVEISLRFYIEQEYGTEMT